ncbi:PQQ-binding-like beta-propeller repeat protein [Natronosalvus vescus]|uniref:outer membrane protein assembly factor BamB family protein n=1 Tax=Natronosalvus vescus TaxID=2953881 RepID=UPI00209006B4|nr:PQQ-binding-like beta-propeller repeat protein [Natronosalvus vescus]
MPRNDPSDADRPALGEAGGIEVTVGIDQLEVFLSADDPEVREYAASTLATEAAERPGDVRSAVPALIDRLEDDAAIRSQATAALAAVGRSHPSAIQDGVPALTDRLAGSATVRADAVEAISAVAADDPLAIAESVEPLTAYVTDDDPAVCQRATAALAAVARESPEIVAPVITDVAAATDHDDLVVRANTVETLATIVEAHPDVLAGEETVAGQLLDRLEDDPAIRADAMAAIRASAIENPDDPALEVDPIAGRLSDEQDDVRIDAAATLEALAAVDTVRVQTGVEPLRRALSDSPAVRASAISAIRAVADALPETDVDPLVSTVPAVTDRLEDVQPPVRLDAAATLDAIGGVRPAALREAIDLLAVRLQDGDGETREHAASALAAVAHEHPTDVARVVPDLAGRLEDEKLTIRADSARAIAAVAPTKPAAVRTVVPALTSSLDTADDTVRRASASALGAVALDGADDRDAVVEHLAHLEAGDSGLDSELDVPRLEAASDHVSDGWQQGHAARSLAEIAERQIAGVHPAVRSLRNRLESDSVTVRRAASRDLVGVASQRPRDVRWAVEPIADRLDDDDASVRNNAAIALGRLAETYPDAVRDALEALFVSVDDPDRTVRTNVISALASVGTTDASVRCPAFSLAVAETGADDPAIRTAALEALAVLRPETGDETKAAVDALLDRFGSPTCTPAERSSALTTLETQLSASPETDPSPMDVVLEELSADDENRARTVTQALANVLQMNPTMIDSIAAGAIDRLETADPALRRALIGAITRGGETTTRPISAVLAEYVRNGETNAAADIAYLAVVAPADVERGDDEVSSLLEHDTEIVRGYATLALAAVAVVGDDDGTTLQGQLETVDDRLLDVASLVVGGETPSHTDAINNQLSGLGRRVESDPWAGGLAILGLSILADATEELRPTAFSKLATGLEADSTVVRATTASVLATMADDDTNGFERVVSAMVRALEDPDDGVRANASQALATLAASGADCLADAECDVRESLLERRSDPEYHVRTQACRALGALGSGSPASVAPLVDDPVPSVGEAATAARARLSGESAADTEHTEWRDWRMERADAAGTGAVPSGDPLSETVDFQWGFDTTELASTIPTIAGDSIYLGSDDGRVIALALEDGSERWSYQTGAAVSTSPAVVDDRVYTVNADGMVYALEQENGERRWQVRLDSSVSVAPVVVDGVVYVGTDDGTVQAIDADTGTADWSVEPEEPTAVTSLAVANDVVVGSAAGDVRALSRADGEGRWHRSLESVADQAASIVSVSIDTGTGAVIAACERGTVVALEWDDGTSRWRFDTGARLETGPAVAHGSAYVASTDLSVYAIDLRSGAERFRFDTGGSTPTAPAVIDGVCCVGTDDGVLYALDAADGTARWRYDTDASTPIEAVAVASGLVCTVEANSVAVLGDENASWADRIGFSGLFTRFGTAE